MDAITANTARLLEAERQAGLEGMTLREHQQRQAEQQQQVGQPAVLSEVEAWEHFYHNEVPFGD
jgi:hypothetical protein